MKRTVLVSLLAVLLVLTAGVGVAGAAPVNNPHAEPFTLVCAGEELEVVVARGNPAFAVGSTKRLIPHEFTFHVDVVVDGERSTIFSESEPIGKGKKVGLQDRLVECEVEFLVLAEDIPEEEKQFFLEETGVDLDEVDEIYGRLEVKVMMTPAGKK
jgi:hypothetical protein